MNERESPHHSPSKIVCRNLLRVRLLKNTETSVSLTDSDVHTFSETEENQNTERKTESYVLSGFGNGISRG